MTSTLASWVPRRLLGIYTRRSESGTLIETYHDAYETNEVGAYIWSKVGLGLTLAEIAEAVSQRYQVDPATASVDIEAFLLDLISRGFIEEPTTAQAG
jgi:hypothetical protein